MSVSIVDQYQLQAINQIAESLSSCERRRLLYLCGCLDSDSSVAYVKEILKSRVLRQDRGHLVLPELLWQLRRFDILRKVFETSRDEVERTVRYRQSLPQFRVLMADISENMATDDLDSVKFLLGGLLPREKLDRAKNFLDVVIELEKLDKVSAESVDFVEECLMNISRVDLAKKVVKYKNSVSPPGHQSPQQQRFSNPCPVTTGYRSHSPRQTRPGQIIHRVISSGQQSPQQQLFSAPCPVTTAYRSHSPRQTSPGQIIHRAPETPRVTAYREQSSQSHVDRYKFSSDPRGVCVIIDCVGNDGDMLEQAFNALHFSVFLHKWLSVDATLAALRETFRHTESLKGDAFVCCVISRGTDGHLLGTDSNVVGLGLNSIRRLFTAEACPALAGKPKLFFIQRYSVPESQPWDRMQHEDGDLETDGLSRAEVIPSDADVFWSHCWTDERLLEQENHRSVYLKSLTDALHRSQRRRTNLLDVHTEMNGAVYEHNRRNPEQEYHFELKHTLRKDLYLH